MAQCIFCQHERADMGACAGCGAGMTILQQRYNLSVAVDELRAELYKAMPGPIQRAIFAGIERMVRIVSWVTT